MSAKKINSLHPRDVILWESQGSMLSHSHLSSFLVLAFNKRFCLCFIHNHGENIETGIRMLDIFPAYFFWDRTGTGTLLLGRSLWLRGTSSKEVQTQSPGRSLWWDAQSWVNPELLRSAWFASLWLYHFAWLRDKPAGYVHTAHLSPHPKSSSSHPSINTPWPGQRAAILGCFLCLAVWLLTASSTGWEACRLPGVQREGFSLACLTTFLQAGFQLTFWLPCCTVLTEWISLLLHTGLSSLSRQAGN